MGGEGSVKWPRSEVDHMILPSAEFKSTWTYASLPHTPLCCGALLIK